MKRMVKARIQKTINQKTRILMKKMVMTKRVIQKIMTARIPMEIKANQKTRKINVLKIMKILQILIIFFVSVIDFYFLVIFNAI